MNLGDLHQAIIHFPIVLTILVLAFDILYWYQRNEIFQKIATWLLYAVLLILIPTAITGLYAKEYYPVNDTDVFIHQYMAVLTGIYTFGYVVFRKYGPISLYIYLLLSFIGVGMVVTTAELGGMVVRGKGIIFKSTRPTGFPLPYNEVKS